MCEECLNEFSYTANHFSGIIYTRQLDHQKAIESNRRAHLCAEALNLQCNIAQMLVNLGIVYMNRGDLVEAVSAKVQRVWLMDLPKSLLKNTTAKSGRSSKAKALLFL